MKVYKYGPYDPATHIVALDRTTYKVINRNGVRSYSQVEKISKRDEADAYSFDRFSRLPSIFYPEIKVYSTEIDGDSYTLTVIPTDTDGNHKLILERIDALGNCRTFHGTRPTRPTINDAANFIRQKATVDGQRPTAIENDYLRNLKQE